ncbi:hypothetical protein, partial [Kitasatospora aureofaciens]
MPIRQHRRLLLSAVTLTALGLTTSQALAAPSAPSAPQPWQVRHQADIGKQHAKKTGATTTRSTFSPKADSGAGDG